ncbi:MAG: hypothetical protein ACLTLQ_06325 [[Clostridium] scindens]
MLEVCYDEDTVTVPTERVFLSIGQSIGGENFAEWFKVELGRGNTAVADQSDPVKRFRNRMSLWATSAITQALNSRLTPLRRARKGLSPSTGLCSRLLFLTIGRNRRQFIELDKENIK